MSLPPLTKWLRAETLAAKTLSLCLGSAISSEGVRDIRQPACCFLPPGTADDLSNDLPFAEDGRPPRPPEPLALDVLGASFVCPTLATFQAGLNSSLPCLPPLSYRRLASADDERRQHGEPEPCSDVCCMPCPSVFEEAVRWSSRLSVVFRSEGGGCWALLVPWLAFPNRNSTSGPLSNGV